jgi:hypothetical protein
MSAASNSSAITYPYLSSSIGKKCECPRHKKHVKDALAVNLIAGCCAIIMVPIATATTKDIIFLFSNITLIYLWNRIFINLLEIT